MNQNTFKKRIAVRILSLLVVFTVGMPLSSAKNSPQSGSKLERELHFDGLSLSGKYQTPGEVLIRAQDEKVLRDLLSMRTDFKDRIRKEMERK